MPNYDVVYEVWNHRTQRNERFYQTTDQATASAAVAAVQAAVAVRVPADAIKVVHVGQSPVNYPGASAVDIETDDPLAWFTVGALDSVTIRDAADAGSAVVWANEVEPTLMRFDQPTRLGVIDGTAASPVTGNSNPAAWIEKVVARRDPNDAFAQNPGAIFAAVKAIGSGSSDPAQAHRGTWNAIVANAVTKGVNRGTPTVQVWDYEGSAIGVTGFARSDGYPGAGHITTGLWGYGVTPDLDATTWANLPSTSWATVGAEVNVDIRHPDPGYRTQVGGKGSTVGFFVFNYQTPGASLRDWTFGIALAGNALDGSFANTDPLNYPGFHTGILVDRIRGDGIQFGPYMFPGSVGIRFPASYAHGFEPTAAISLGNNKINMGQYVGATFNENDFWHNAGELWFRYSSVSERLITERSGVLRMLGTAYDVETDAGDEIFGFSHVASAVNQFRIFNAVTGNAPALICEGDDATIPLELRPKGASYVFTTGDLRWRPTTGGATLANGDLTVYATSNTNVRIGYRGSDGVTRTADITVA